MSLSKLSTKKKAWACVAVFAVAAALLTLFLHFAKTFKGMADYDDAYGFAMDVFVYSNKHGELPVDMSVFCEEIAHACRPNAGERYASNYERYIHENYSVHKVSQEEFMRGSCYVSAKQQKSRMMAEVVNERLRELFRFQADGAATYIGNVRWNGKVYLGDVDFKRLNNMPSKFDDSKVRELSKDVCDENSLTNLSNVASEKNQVMDELLNQPQVPADYGNVMVELYRDKSQGVLTRDFAVQHIGLYAQALSRRGKYVPESEDARKCRAALFDAASETHTIVAAAAFRALADMSEFDSRVDAPRLDSLLASCAADASATLAARAMAVQLCGERRIAASRPALEKAASDPAVGEVVRRSAKYALSLIDGGEVMR